MLIAARNLAPALDFVQGLDEEAEDLDKQRGGRQEGLRRHRAARPYAGRHRPGQDRQPGGRRGDPPGHERARLRPGDHGGRRLEPALAGAQARDSIDELLKASHFVTLHVPLVEKTRHLVNAKNVEHAARRRDPAQFLARRRGRRRGGAEGAAQRTACAATSPISPRRRCSASPAWSRCRTWAPRRARPRTIPR